MVYFKCCSLAQCSLLVAQGNSICVCLLMPGLVVILGPVCVAGLSHTQQVGLALIWTADIKHNLTCADRHGLRICAGMSVASCQTLGSVPSQTGHVNAWTGPQEFFKRHCQLNHSSRTPVGQLDTVLGGCLFYF